MSEMRRGIEQRAGIRTTGLEERLGVAEEEDKTEPAQELEAKKNVLVSEQQAYKRD